MIRTREEQDVEMVAGIIAENQLTEKTARELNDGDGWSFNVQYEENDYFGGEGQWTRVDHRTLCYFHLAKALYLAAEWTRPDIEDAI